MSRRSGEVTTPVEEVMLGRGYCLTCFMSESAACALLCKSAYMVRKLGKATRCAFEHE